jgi:hypothetical protein
VPHRRNVRQPTATLLSRAPAVAIREGLNTDCSGQVIRPVIEHANSNRQGLSTGLTTGACPGYRKDHIQALTCGGADAVWSLQWQTIASVTGLPPSSPLFYG